MSAYVLDAIGTVHSCFTEKFGIPRQPGIVPQAKAVIEMAAPYGQSDAFRGLEQFSHLWVVFIFHHCLPKPWRSTVRPPRLGGNRRLGVFATRSGFRPNPIGQSAVKLEKIVCRNGSVQVHISGHDLLDGTPVIDIKPYLPYSDAVPSAYGAYAEARPAPKLQVHFSGRALTACHALEADRYPQLTQLITSALTIDPRPAYVRHDPDRLYGMRLWDLDIHFRVASEGIIVETIASVGPEHTVNVS